MKLSPVERDMLREKLILECHDAGKAGAQVSTLIRKAADAGYEDVTGADLDQELRYLEGAGMIEEVRAGLSGNIRRYRSTKAGYDHLEGKGLV
jgi:hypothetical protein